MSRIIAYLIPVLVWAVAVQVLFQPKNFGEFIFVGHWLLIPLVPFYLLWVPLVRWLLKPTSNQ